MAQINEAINVTINTNAEQAAKATNDYTSQLRNLAAQYTKLTDIQKKSEFGKGLANDMASLQDKIKGVNVAGSGLAESIENTEKKAGTLKSQLRELKNQLGQLEEGSPAFIKLAKQAGELQGQIEAVNQTTAFFKDSVGETAFKGLIGTAELATAGFGAVQGAMALFGGQSKELDKVLTQVNSTMLVLNSLQAIQANLQKDSAARIYITTVATRAYNAVTKLATASTLAFNVALGGLLLVAGLVVAFLPQIIDFFSKQPKEVSAAAEAQTNYNKTLAETTVEMNKERAAVEANLSIAKDETKSRKLRQQALNEAIEKQPVYLKGLTLENIETEKGIAIIDNYRLAFQKLIKSKAAEAELIKIETRLLELEGKGRQKTAKEINDLANAEAKRLEDLGATPDLIEKARQNTKNIYGAIQSVTAKEYESLIAQREFYLSKIEISDQSFQKSTEKTVKAQEKIVKKSTEQIELLAQKLPTTIEVIGMRAAQLQEKFIKDLSVKTQLELANNEQLYVDYTNSLIAADERFLQKQQAIFEARQTIFSETSKIFGSLVNIIAGEGEKANGIQKALALVQIAIDSASAISSALRTSYATTPEPIAATVKAAAVTGIILANVARIKQVLDSGKPPTSGLGGGAGIANTSNFTAQLPTGQSAQPAVTENKIIISERDIRKASRNAAERNRGATVVV